MNQAVLKKINSNLEVLSGIFDIVRIVNPFMKKVLTIEGGVLSETPLTCFGFWSHNKQCINCISMRAYREKEVFAKIEYNNQAVFLMLSIPYTMEDGLIIVELMKDMTKNMLLLDKDTGKAQNMHTLIADLNLTLLTDSLTKIYNRRFINERLPADILNSATNNRPITIIMSDIDHFKRINDEYGHIAGDYVLCQVAQELKMLAGKSSWTARYGGEEFLICLLDTEKQKAIDLAERIRAGIEAMEIDYTGNHIKITMSFGLCTVQGENISPETLVENADQKMYTAKQNGRNRVVF